VTPPEQQLLSDVRKAHVFKTFRKNTKFKKFNKGLVDFVRRKNIRRKKSFSYLSLSYMSSSWSKHYINNRSIQRFYQSLFSSNFSFQSVNPELVSKLALKTNYTKGMSLSSIPTRRATNLINHNSPVKHTFNRGYNTKGSILSLNSFEFNHNEISKLGTSNYVDYNNDYFVTHLKHNKAKYLKTDFTLNASISILASMRRIIILTIILSSF
jgi:hypothetical protein